MVLKKKTKNSLFSFQQIFKKAYYLISKDYVFSLLIFAGSVLILIFILGSFFQSGKLYFKNTSNIKSVYTSTDFPSAKKIVIPALSIALSVTEANITGGIWEVSENGVSHLSKSANPGQKGNVIMYGHNLEKILGKLAAIKSDDKITVLTIDGKVYTYQVKQIMVVNPNQVEVLLPTDKETLTLFTCTGLLDTQRFVVKAERV